MRRSDREVTDLDIIDDILRSAEVFHMAIPDPAAAPYVVPLNYGYDWVDGNPVLYFHGALAGRKYELLKNGAEVGFSIDCDHRLLTDLEAQKTSYAFRSIIGTGTVRLLTDLEEKRQAMAWLMLNLTGESVALPDPALQSTAVFALRVEAYDAKQNLPEE